MSFCGSRFPKDGLRDVLSALIDLDYLRELHLPRRYRFSNTAKAVPGQLGKLISLCKLVLPDRWETEVNAKAIGKLTGLQELVLEDSKVFEKQLLALALFIFHLSSLNIVYILRLENQEAYISL